MLNQSVQLANTFGRWLFDQLWQMSLELIVLAIVVSAAIALLRIRSAALRHLFWCLLLAKPVATFLIASPVSLYWFLNPRTEVITQPTPIVAEQMALPQRPSYPVRQRTVAGVPHIISERPVEARKPVDRFGILAVVWLAGSIALALRLVFGFAYVSFLRRTAALVREGPLRRIVDRTAADLGVRSRVDIGISSVSHGPILAGILRPAILIPETLVSELMTDQMRSIIAHELVHARRRDNLVLLVQRFAEMLFFFHPVVWFGGKMMRREAESACDDAVLDRIGDSATYADSLTRIAEMRFSLTQRFLVNTFAAAETNFSRRLRRILDSSARRMTVRVSFVSVGTLILISCFGLPRVAEQQSTIKETVPSTGGSSVTKDAAGDRMVLEGVRKVAYTTDRWRFTPFCNALDACLQYLGQEEQYDYLMTVSGAAFRTTWAPKMWDGGNSDILGMAVETLEPMERAFRAVGYKMLPVAKAVPEGWPEDILHDNAQRLGGDLTDEAGFRRHIVASIDSGRPVIAFGIIGPPEAAVITGYDEKGDVLIGWNVFQKEGETETEPNGMFRVQDWYGKTRGLLLFEEKIDAPPRDELDRSTLLWAVEVLRTSQASDHAAGKAAFDTWAADMEDDEYFPADNPGILHGRLDCHWDAMTMQAERATAVAFLTEVAEREPAMAENLRAAAEELQKGGVKHGVAPGERDQIARLADPEVRREVSQSIRATGDSYRKIAYHIEQALLASGVDLEDIPRQTPVATEEQKDPDEYLVLEGVPKVGHGLIDGHVGMTPFPACMRSALEYLGDDLGFDNVDGRYPRGPVYAYLMGTTGAAFRLLWKEGWHGDNVASWLLNDNPAEIFRRGFDAAGYKQIGSGSGPRPGGEERKDFERRMREMVIESIRDRGRPVIAHGVIGPPEEAIIAGYGEGGQTVMGWSYFQDDAIGKAGVEFLPNGYYRKRNWEADTWGMMAIGDKIGTPERRATYIEALKNALPIIRDLSRYGGDRHNGLAAYDAWAEHILRDDEIAAGGAPDEPYMVHSDAIDVIAEGRHYASVFLKQSAEVLPEAEEQLLAASDNFKAQHDMMWEIWGIVGSNQRTEETRTAFTDPDVRRKIVPIIRQARDKQAEAADLIEAALKGIDPDIDLSGSGTSAYPSVSGGSGVAEGGPKMLEGLKFPNRLVTHLGCIKASLDYLGKDVSWPWLYGGTGHAFIINIHSDVDLEAATAFDDRFLFELAPNLGYKVSGFDVNKRDAGDAYSDRQKEAWDFVRGRIDDGKPCYGWELKAPYGDYWLITGYDEVGYHYAGHETGGPTPWDMLGDQFIDHLDVRSVELCDPADDETVIADALARAIEFNVKSDSGVDSDAHQGPSAWAAWSKALENGTALRNHHAYLAKVWLECRKEGIAFLQEARKRLPGRFDGLAAEAIGHYREAAKQLEAAVALHPIRNDTGWDPSTVFQSSGAAGLIKAAGEADTQGLEQLKQILLTLRPDHKMPQPSTPAVGGNGVKRLVGLGSKQLFVSELASIKGCSEYLGGEMSSAWLYGGTGHAFIINVTDDANVSGPTAWRHEMLHGLARNLGYRITGVVARKEVEGAAYPEKQREAWDFVRKAVDEGIPCYGFEIWPWIPDYQVIGGYDDTGYYYSAYGGVHSGGPAPWDKYGDNDIKAIQVYRVEQTDSADDETVVREGLAAAVRHATQPDQVAFAGYQTGPEAFGVWARALESGNALRDHHTYNLQVWHECRDQGLGFLQEVKQRLPGRVDALVDEATGHYTLVRDKLAEAIALHPDRGPDNTDWGEKLESTEAAELMRAAGAAEKEGLEVLAKIVVALGGDAMDTSVSPPANDPGDSASVQTSGAGTAHILVMEDFEQGIPPRTPEVGWSGFTAVEGGAGGSKYAARSAMGPSTGFWGWDIPVDENLVLSFDIYFDERPSAATVRRWSEKAGDNFGQDIQTLEPRMWHHVEFRVDEFATGSGSTRPTGTMRNANFWVRGPAGGTYKIDNLKIIGASMNAAIQAAESEFSPQIDWVPEGKPEWHTGWMNGYSRGLDLILNRMGTEVDYVTIMGDLGTAFILQGQENSKNQFDGAVDVGWWPLEPLGFMRMGFLEQTTGRKIADLKLPSGIGREDPLGTYKQRFEPSVATSVDSGRPCLVYVGSAWYVITGYDDDESPLIGTCPNFERGKEVVGRTGEPYPPYAALIVGDERSAIDRKEADLEALKYAVALHRDQVLGPDAAYDGSYPLRRAEEYGVYWRTGVKSFAAWIACLEDTEHLGQSRWHSNVVSHLYWNRTTAVRYLEAMKERHSPTVAAHLNRAIENYQAVIEAVGGADTSEVLMKVEGRAKLISTIQKIVELESQAAAALEKAAEAIG